MPLKISNKRIEAFILRKEQPYWIRYKFGGHHYLLTFEFNLYQYD